MVEIFLKNAIGMSEEEMNLYGINVSFKFQPASTQNHMGQEPE